MNHGYCKNCWWWDNKVAEVFKYGKCYMHKGENEPYTPAAEDGYCPDYTNRKKEEKKCGTLEDWIKNAKQ